MEGVGARLGRSSTRYGPTTVFSGPVRRWKKKWVPLSNPSSGNSSNHHHHHTASHANGNSNNHAHLLVYKWIPVSSSANGAAASATPTKNSEAADDDEQPRRKFRYVPISTIEEQKPEASAKSDEDSKPSESDLSPHPSQIDHSDMKPDINDVPMEGPQASGKGHAPAEMGNSTNLDLSLGLNSEGDRESEPKATRPGEG